MRKLSALLVLAAASASQAALLYDNGTFVTGTGNGFGGNNTSQIATGYNIFGPSINQGGNFFVADNVTVGAVDWVVDSFTFYTYQTQTNGNTNDVSTITAARVGIYSAMPTDLTTGLVSGGLGADGSITGNAFSGTYRVTSTTLTNSARAIMAVTVDMGGVTLNANTTYWFGWGAAGSVASGPWGVPTAATAGDARQWNGTAWAQLDGNSTTAPPDIQAYDLAFQITGEPVPEPATMIALGGALAAFARRRRK